MTADGRTPNGERVTDIVIRLDERTARMAQDLEKLSTTVVTQTEFKPVKAVVYGLVAVILTSVIVAIVALVIQRGGQ